MKRLNSNEIAPQPWVTKRLFGRTQCRSPHAQLRKEPGGEHSHGEFDGCVDQDQEDIDENEDGHEGQNVQLSLAASER